MRLELHKEIHEDAELRRQWNELVLRVEQPQVFYTYEWALAVYRAYHATLHPLLFLAYDEQDSLCGVAALATDPTGRRASFLCATTADYCDFLSSIERRPELVNSVLAELKRQSIPEIVLANLPNDSTTASIIGKAGSSHRYHVFTRTGYICAQVSLNSLERGTDGRPVLPRRKTVRRFLNAMGRESPVRVDHLRTWDASQPGLQQFMQAHVARFLATERISNIARKERQVFLTELTGLLSESGWLVLSQMKSGAQVLAWNYGFQFQGTWFWYQPTFESDKEKYSPGLCLLTKLIEEAADTPGLRVFDLGLGAEEYKDIFANQTRKTLYVTLKASAAEHYGEIVRYHAAELVKTVPRGETFVRAMAQRRDRLKKVVAEKGIVAVLKRVGRRLRELLWLQIEVSFYEWCGSVPGVAHTLTLQPIDLNVLAAATIQYVDDRETLAYLVRAASRVRRGTAEGFALLDADGKCVHFAWATAFEGFFLSELNAKVNAPSPDCVMLFDCWTPASVRGHGYYAQTVERIAKKVYESGKRPWIFSAATNMASVRGLQATGFQQRYSLVRRRLLGRQWIKGETPKVDSAPAVEVSARV